MKYDTDYTASWLGLSGQYLTWGQWPPPSAVVSPLLGLATFRLRRLGGRAVAAPGGISPPAAP